MRSFYFPDKDLGQTRHLALPDDLRKHLKTVLRLSSGDEVLLFNGVGTLARAVLAGESQLHITGVSKIPEPGCLLTLLQGVPKGDKLELILQKGTELGVHCFSVVPMARSVGQVKKERLDKKLLRWERIVQEAARQSHQFRLPEIRTPDSLGEALLSVHADLKLVLWEESRRPLQEVLVDKAPRSIAVMIGPEGGICREETEAAEAAGFEAVSLGPRILRTETAGLAIMSILQYLYGDLATGSMVEKAVFCGKEET